MVDAVTEVVEPTFSVGKETAGGSTHAVAIGSFNNVGCGREGGAADGVVLGTGPESEDHEIEFVRLPPEWIVDVGGGRPEDGRDGMVWRV